MVKNREDEKYAPKPFGKEVALGALFAPVTGGASMIPAAVRVGQEAYKKGARGESKIANFFVPDKPVKAPQLPARTMDWLRKIEKEKEEWDRETTRHMQPLEKRLEQEARAHDKKMSAFLDNFIAREERGEKYETREERRTRFEEGKARRAAQKEKEKAIDEMRHPESFKTGAMEAESAFMGGGGPFDTDAEGEDIAFVDPSTSFTDFTGDPIKSEPDLGGLRDTDFASSAAFDRAVAERQEPRSADAATGSRKRGLTITGLDAGPRELGTFSGAMNRAGRRLQRKGAWGEAQKVFGGAEVERLKGGSRISTPERREREAAERRELLDSVEEEKKEFRRSQKLLNRNATAGAGRGRRFGGRKD